MTGPADDAVDLRLAESYIPVCLAIAKSGCIVALHAFLGDPRRAHAFTFAGLVLDRVAGNAQERIVDSNAVAWGVAAAFLMLVNSSMPTMDADHDGVTVPLEAHIPGTVALLFAVWLLASTVHITHGYAPILYGGSTAVTFCSAFRPAGTPLPHSEVLALAFSALASTVVCDERVRAVLFRGNPRIATPGTIDLALSADRLHVVGVVGIRAAVYVTLSCVWTYAGTWFARRGPGGIQGRTVAKHAAPLTASRFFVVFCTPVALMLPWAVVVLGWVAWACTRHASMARHPKRNEDTSAVLSGLRALEEATESVVGGLAGDAVKASPARTDSTDSTAQQQPPQVHPQQQQHPPPPTQAAAAPPKQFDPAVLAAFNKARGNAGM
jgi:hypothetical protein